MPVRTVEKIVVVVAVVVLGVALSLGVTGLPLAGLATALVFTVSAGLDLVMRGEARTRSQPEQFVLPTAVVLGALLFLPLLPTGALFVVGLGAFACVLFVVLWTEWAMARGAIGRERGETTLALIGYVTAFILYGAIYQVRARSLISASAIVAISFLLAARHLRLTEVAFPDRTPDPGSAPDPASLSVPERLRLSGRFTTTPEVTPSGRHVTLAPSWRRTLMYAGVTGVGVGEVTWALNYWPLNGLQGGAFLLAVYYFTTGVLTYALHTRLTKRVTLEYGIIALVGLVVLAVVGLSPRGL
ncbi:MAG: hypothetical protein EBS89_02895 [Proteobacteria bacterium]|jgi:hypothetical protein|nr:hypothetical protein [Pseudomonadota bacterium]